MSSLNCMKYYLSSRKFFLFIRNRIIFLYHAMDPDYNKLKDIFDSGELVVIPAGFRCYTKMRIFKELGLKQASLPFDSGFFSSYAVAEVLKSRKVFLNYPEEYDETHCVCIKDGNYQDEKFGRGIKFQTSSYTEINELVKDRNQDDIECYLDTTYGFYTLDKKHKFVLAHYNWHPFASQDKSQGIYDISLNLKSINRTINNRIERMFDMCNKARYVVFTIDKLQNCHHMTIDNEVFDLNDLEPIINAAQDSFGSKCFVVHFSEINSPSKLLKLIHNQT
ncbi:hypothetical protein VSP9026_03484 [Vibrio spartinae]|uniref:Uncharacterized protein n=1 Tax=Vibrio spartinae TaxID=1918945 RepID=A0A1N6M8G9_9VIBR|nr:hypothetical protein VSP9026_03484 [Vibrio spartinae]